MNVITINPHILGGTPVLAGTRVPIVAFFDSLKHGRSLDYFLEQFPTVSRAQLEVLLDQARGKMLPESSLP